MKINRSVLYLLTLSFILFNSINAQTTGKISGKIFDSETGISLAGANVLILGTNYGAASNTEGKFDILNVSPGSYNLRAQMIGYQSVQIQNVVVSVNRTTYLDIPMSQTSIEIDEVVVSSSKIAQKKDQTASIKNVSAEEIEAMPVDNIYSVVNMQAGVVRGHFRGGRERESVTLVDGIQVDNAFRRSMMNVEKEVVQDLEVVTGTFNAEYGNAMSGIVNMVTKDGGQKFEGFASANLGNYMTSNTHIFPGLSYGEINRIQDFKLNLSGPLFFHNLSFISNVRYRQDKNHLNYIRRFTPVDYNNYDEPDTNTWHSEQTGDMKHIPSYRNSIDLFGKISYKPVPSVRTSITGSFENIENKNYEHGWKYNPDGVAKNRTDRHSVIFQVNHTITNRLFYLLQAAHFKNFTLFSLYEDPLDERYLNDGYTRNGGTGFYMGGGSSRTTMKPEPLKPSRNSRLHGR